MKSGASRGRWPSSVRIARGWHAERLSGVDTWKTAAYDPFRNARQRRVRSITAGFRFDVPVRFAEDRLEVSLAAVTLQEMRPRWR